MAIDLIKLQANFEKLFYETNEEDFDLWINNKKMKENNKVYLIEVNKGSWDDFAWWVHGIYDCPFKADEAKRKLLSKIEESKNSKNIILKHQAQAINAVDVKEYNINEISKNYF